MSEMKIDEAIQHATDVAEKCEDKQCALEYAQLARWLSELKWRRNQNDYFNDYWEARRRAERAERLLQDGLAPKEVGRAQHIADLEIKNKRLKEEVRQMQLKAEEFNRLLFATGLIVNCTGCVAGAPDNYKDLTEEKVKTVERIAERLRTWWNTNKDRI